MDFSPSASGAHLKQCFVWVNRTTMKPAAQCGDELLAPPARVRRQTNNPALATVVAADTVPPNSPSSEVRRASMSNLGSVLASSFTAAEDSKPQEQEEKQPSPAQTFHVYMQAEIMGKSTALNNMNGQLGKLQQEINERQTAVQELRNRMVHTQGSIAMLHSLSAKFKEMKVDGPEEQ